MTEVAPPTRQLSKQEATRHLIHGAVRLFMAAEDPFIIHMLVQSADKLLIDVAAQTKKPLKHDWADYIKPEKKQLFFQKLREVYNFFKHAKHDFGKDLPVNDIVRFNIATLFVAIQNYGAVYGAITDHMKLHNIFVQAVMPGIFSVEMEADKAAQFAEALKKIGTMTATEFFSVIAEYKAIFAPGFDAEATEDLKDAKSFYAMTFADLHKIDAAIK